jgi:hypothetical protein
MESQHCLATANWAIMWVGGHTSDDPTDKQSGTLKKYFHCYEHTHKKSGCTNGELIDAEHLFE